MSEISLTDFASFAYKDYALYVLHDRALPRLIDGLKPVQRRLILAMHQLHLDYKAKPKKSARAVGDVLGKYHPHSNEACYEALVNLSQDFATRYPLLHGQGNFGSQDDPKSFAAMRYTEVKLSLYADLLLDDLNEDVVPWQANFDGTLKEPVYFPAQVPMLLANGCSGIAVGMSCEIPPFNLGEIIDALILMLKVPKLSLESLIEVLPGPDFPTGGVLKASYDQIKEFYTSSQASFVLEGKYEIQSKKVLITELPYTVSTSRLIEQIQQLASKKILTGLSDMMDLSDHEQPVCLEISFKSQSDLYNGLKTLLEKTDLRRVYRSYFNILDENNRPGGITLVDFLKRWLACRQKIVLDQHKRRLRLIEKRLHILNALFCVFHDIENIIAIIRQEDEPWAVIAQKYDLDKVQIEALRQLRLSQLTKLNENDLQKEKDELEQEKIETYGLIQSPTKLKAFIRKQLKALQKVYSDQRRTQIHEPSFEQVPLLAHLEKSQEVIKEYPVTLVLTKMGWLKAFKSHEVQEAEFQKSLRSTDQVISSHLSLSTDQLVLWDDKGRVYALDAHKIPTSRFGEHISSFISLPSGHHITHLSSRKTTLVVTQEDLAMRLELTDIDLTTRGSKLIDMPEGVEIKFLSEIKGPYLLVFSQKGYAALKALEIPSRKKGKGQLLVSRLEEPLETFTFCQTDVEIIWKKGRTKALQKEFNDILIKRGGKLKKIPAKFLEVQPEIKNSV